MKLNIYWLYMLEISISVGLSFGLIYSFLLFLLKFYLLFLKFILESRSCKFICLLISVKICPTTLPLNNFKGFEHSIHTLIQKNKILIIKHFQKVIDPMFKKSCLSGHWYLKTIDIDVKYWEGRISQIENL